LVETRKLCLKRVVSQNRAVRVDYDRPEWQPLDFIGRHGRSTKQFFLVMASPVGSRQFRNGAFFGFGSGEEPLVTLALMVLH
jgi:hypothetical protein